MPVVGAAAAALAALIVEPMPVKSLAAASITSGVAITNDIAYSQQVLEKAAKGAVLFEVSTWYADSAAHWVFDLGRRT
ncbi:hypothetical protein A5787_13480 [Mycobacterium sp. 852002-50816_SCH5313054-b]|nr:hypothetical protein A5787_13480 [Mycobacterium sp. 852002-50816_SCH5313054-b]